MASLHVLNGQGDTRYEWDPRGVAQGDPEAVAAVREAERIFAAQRQGGATAFRVAPDGQTEQLETFEPQAERIVLVPRVAGGQQAPTREAEGAEERP